jgi:phage terminase large subunit
MQVTRTFMRLANTKKRLVLSRGGSSSSKTYSKVQMLTKWLRTGELRRDEWIPQGVATIAREHATQLNKSVLRDFKNICRDEWLWFSQFHSGNWVFKENKTERTYEYEGRILEFIWMDDPEKAKGPRREILYLNEANNIDYGVFKQLMMRTKVVCFCDWNPDDEDVWLNTEIEQKRATLKGDVDLIVSTFRDNAYLEEEIVQELLSLKDTDPELWNIYWNWGYWKIEWVIFEQWVHWDTIDEIPKEAEEIWVGMDFWFSNDPTACIKWYKYDKNTIILDEVFWETNLVNTYEDDSMMQSSIQGHFEMNWIWVYEDIFADSSEPKSIEEISQKGYNIVWVKKGPGSVVSWIKLMKRYKILVTKRSLNLIKEFKKYIWKTDKYWKIVKDREGRPVPLDKFNHWMDASRYLIIMVFWEEQMWEISFSIL